MRIDRLRLSNVRNLDELDLTLVDGVNYFVGPNGAGKTSIIEAAYLLGYGSSFRSAQNSVIARRDGGALSIHAEVSRRAGHARLDLLLENGGWLAKVNGDRASGLASALAEFAIVCFEPGSHSLISNGGAERRRFYDWILFHVEPSYLGVSRAFRRILRQRNAVLKAGGTEAELAIWDAEFAAAGQALAEIRESLFARYALELSRILSTFLSELGQPQVVFKRGWPESESLSESLMRSRQHDRARGHTTRGPHRADWVIGFDKAPTRDSLSRGQEKLCALACVLTQANLFAMANGEWPVVALDDFSSELDARHRQVAMDLLLHAPAQILITGIDLPSGVAPATKEFRLFHVEHGLVR